MEKGGLLLKFECGHSPELSTDIQIPFADIKSITLESKAVRKSRRETHRWRQYRIKTSRPDELSNLLINTFRPLHWVIADLQRIAPLLLHRVDIHLIGTLREMVAFNVHWENESSIK